MKFLDLFAGIGGFRLGMEQAGHKCVGFCEIDKFARASYKAIHDTSKEVELHDITSVSDEFVRGIGSVDIICGGFPCQAFSIAGNRRGFEDTRGTLFFEIARFASILRPKYLFLENVVGLLTHEGGATFSTILGTMDELGYNVERQVFNSKHFGVPQHRERVFIIGHLRGAGTKPIFPYGGTDGKTNQNNIKTINNPKKIRELLKYESIWRVLDTTGVAPTLDTMQGGNREPKIAIKDSKTGDLRIRKLTPRECWRLQGFPDWSFDKAKEVNSNSQLYKQAGNSVTVPVIRAIAEKLI